MPAPTVMPSSEYVMPKVPTWQSATNIPYNAVYSINLSGPDNMIIIDWPTIGDHHTDELSKFQKYARCQKLVSWPQNIKDWSLAQNYWETFCPYMWNIPLFKNLTE